MKYNNIIKFRKLKNNPKMYTKILLLQDSYFIYLSYLMKKSQSSRCQSIYRPKVCVKCQLCVDRINRHITTAHGIGGKEERANFMKKYSAEPIITIDPQNKDDESCCDGEPKKHESMRGVRLLSFAKRLTTGQIKTFKLQDEYWKFWQV